MSRCSLAYVVQLDLPGGPIKIGHSSQPRNRFKSFDFATPCDARIVGITLHGKQREADMLAATESRSIKGEWRYPTAPLMRLLSDYHDAGEWFVPVDDHKAHFEQTNVAARLREIMPTIKWPISSGSLGYHWANDVLKVVTPVDQSLHLDWAGFVPSSAAPSLHWPQAVRRAA